MGGSSGRQRRVPRLRASGDRLLPLHEHSGSLLHGLSRRYRHPAALWSDGFRRLVRGLYRRTLAHVRCAEQHPAHRPRAHRPWTRCDGRGDQQHVRSQHARGLHGLDRRGQRALSTKQESAIRPESHAPPDRAARHDLPLLGTGELRRASHDVSATRESRSPARQHEAGNPAAPVGSSLASRRLRQFGGHRHVRRPARELRFDSTVTLEHIETRPARLRARDRAHTYPFQLFG